MCDNQWESKQISGGFSLCLRCAKIYKQFEKFCLQGLQLETQKWMIKNRIFAATAQAWKPPKCQNSLDFDASLRQAL